jgi:hypothetical protein
MARTAVGGPKAWQSVLPVNSGRIVPGGLPVGIAESTRRNSQLQKILK